MNDYRKFSIITDTQIQDGKYIHKLCNYTKSELDNSDISITQNQLNIINDVLYEIVDDGSVHVDILKQICLDKDPYFVNFFCIVGRD
jgi:hypothetical protein